MGGERTKGGASSAAYQSAVDDESQRDEMNAAIQAQRERGAVPRSMLPPEDELPVRPPAPEPPSPEPAPKRGLLARLLGR
jgi:hypothetical protein